MSSRGKKQAQYIFNFAQPLKANVVVYVIDFTKFDISGEDELLQEIKRQREKFNPQFYEKFFFVINKIDMHEAYKGASLEAKLHDIRDRITEGYGYKVPENHIIGVAAKPALLYRLDEQRLLDKERKKEFQKFFGQFLDLDDVTPESVIEAKSQVLSMSNIAALDNAIVNYLKNSNQTRELIIDAINKAKMFIQDYKKPQQRKLGVFKTNLEELEEKATELEKWVKEAEEQKKQLITELERDHRWLIGNFFEKYEEFGKKLKSIVDSMFINSVIVKEIGEEENWFLKAAAKIKEAAESILGLKETQEKSQVEKVIKRYNDVLIETTRDSYTCFEAELKATASELRRAVYDKTDRNANQLLSNLNRKVGETLKIDIDRGELVFPPLELESVIDKVEESVYKPRSDREADQWDCWGNANRWKDVTYFSIDRDVLKETTKANFDVAVKNGKGKIKELVDEDIKKIKKYIVGQIDRHIQKLRQNLAQAIEKRKTVGFNAEEEIVKIESEIEQVDEKLVMLNMLDKATISL
ncbi:MAG TPA: hypothetical protein V6D28_22085 [Leptolyngbyaceae cyanobacterium]